MEIIKNFFSAKLLPESKEKIAGAVGITYDKVFLHHCTLGYNPTVDEYNLITKNGTIKVGTPMIIRCRSSISSDQWGVQAIRVEVFFEDGSPVYSTNAHTHITVSTNGAPPVKSNGMLAQYTIGQSGDFVIQKMNLEVPAVFHEGH
jgi:hypothetical protein